MLPCLYFSDLFIWNASGCRIAVHYLLCMSHMSHELWVNMSAMTRSAVFICYLYILMWCFNHNLYYPPTIIVCCSYVCIHNQCISMQNVCFCMCLYVSICYLHVLVCYSYVLVFTHMYLYVTHVYSCGVLVTNPCEMIRFVLVNAAANHNAPSNRCLPNMLAMLFTRHLYHGLVYNIELLQRQTSSADLIYFDLPFLHPR